MSHKHCDFVAQVFCDTLIKDCTCNFWVDSTKRIVKQEDVSIRIDCSCQTNTSLLAARDIHTTLSNHCLITFGKLVHVLDKLTHLQGNLESLSVVIETEADVVSD